MSTLKTNNIQHVDRSDPSIIINTDGSVNIAGTMTYEDVTNVDAVGIITGRNNIDAQKQVLVGTGVSVKAGGINVTAGITTVQALQATTLTLTNDLFMSDGDQIELGTDNDLKIYHSGFNYIESHNDAEIHINANTGGSVENMAKFKPNGAVELYHNGSKKFETTTDGTTFTGSIHTISSGNFYPANDNNIQLGLSNRKWSAINGVSLNINGGDAEFRGTTPGTTDMTWDQSENALNFDDNVYAHFGTGDDLKIYHDGNSKIQNTNDSCDFRIQSNTVEIKPNTTDHLMAKFTSGGSADLYHNNTLKLNTTSSGVTIQNGHLALNRQDTGNEGGEIVFNRASDNANQWFNDVYGNDSSARIRWHHGGSEKVSFITDGGITFNGDTATANALDDYEEGSWTPTSRNDGSFTSSTGRYVKIGQQVTVYGFIPTVTNNTSNNILQCSGLPYTVTSSGHTEFVGPLMIRFLNATGLTGVSFNVYTASGRDYLEFFACRDDDNNYEAVKHSDLAYTNSNGIRFSISYTV